MPLKINGRKLLPEIHLSLLFTHHAQSIRASTQYIDNSGHEQEEATRITKDNNNKEYEKRNSSGL